MSRYCLVSYRKNVDQEDSFYDCIYDENSDLDTLLNEWICLDKDFGYYLGPWKLTVRDKQLWPKFIEDFGKIKDHCDKLSSLEDIWTIHVDGIMVSKKTPEFVKDALNHLSEYLRDNDC